MKQLVRKVRARLRETRLWEFGRTNVKMGWSVAGYLILLCFFGYAIIRSEDSSDKAIRASRASTETALEIARLNVSLTYAIQLSDYSNCLRTLDNQQNVREYNGEVLEYNRAVLDYATQEGIDATPLYEDLEELTSKLEDLYIRPVCLEPIPPTLPTVKED